MKTRISTMPEEDAIQFQLTETGDCDHVAAWLDIEIPGVAEWTVYVDEMEHDSITSAVRSRLELFKASIDECLAQLDEFDREDSNQLAMNLGEVEE